MAFCQRLLFHPGDVPSSIVGGRFTGLLGDHEVHNDEDMPQRAEVHSPATLERYFDLTMADSDVEVGATALDPVAPTMLEPADNSQQVHSTTIDSDGPTPQESEILSQRLEMFTTSTREKVENTATR